MKELHLGPVIVLAPRDAVVVFASTADLLRDLEEMDFGVGQRSRYFAVDGAELELVQERGVSAIVRNRPPGTTTETVIEVDEAVLRDAANRVLSDVWSSRFPRRPRWLHHVVHGRTPPQA